MGRPPPRETIFFFFFFIYKFRISLFFTYGFHRKPNTPKRFDVTGTRHHLNSVNWCMWTVTKRKGSRSAWLSNKVKFPTMRTLRKSNWLQRNRMSEWEQSFLRLHHARAPKWLLGGWGRKPRASNVWTWKRCGVRIKSPTWQGSRMRA